MHTSKKRRGRPRHNRPTLDRGTKELQHKRKLLLGVNPEQNPVLAESLLGVLYGRQLLSRPLYEAGNFFGELGYRYEPCLGHKFRPYSSTLSSIKIDHQGPSVFMWSDEQLEKRTMAWREALQALKQAGMEPYRIVLDVVFYDQDLYARPLLPSIMAVMQPLRKGLESLEVHFKEGLQGGRGKNRGRALNPDRSTRIQQPLKELRSYSLV